MIFYYLSLSQSNSWTALFFAAERGNLDLVKILLQGGARVEIMDKVSLIAIKNAFLLLQF